MLTQLYRGHWITLTEGQDWSAEIREHRSGEALPTRSTALLREGSDVCLKRAHSLIDIYLSAFPEAA